MKDGTSFEAASLEQRPDLADRFGLMSAGTVAEWEQWTGMRFPESGEYIIPGALQPAQIDRENDTGRCDDPNVWMRHPVP
jgi:hypothetical protein